MHRVRISSKSITFRLRVCGLSAIWLVAAPLSADEPDTYLLHYKFQPGQTWYYVVENTGKIVTKYDSFTETMTNRSQAWKQLRVTAVGEDGNAQLEPMVERVVMSATKDGEEPVNYDSAIDENPPLQFLEVKRTINQVQAVINVAANGDLTKVIPRATDNPKLIAAAEKKDPRLNFLIVMPEEPVRIGDTWKNRFTSEVTVGKGLQQEVTLQRKYKLIAVKGSIAVIEQKIAVLTPVNDPQIQAQLMQHTPSGHIEFDLEQGLIVSMRTHVDEMVVGPFGPKSSISAVTKSEEKLLPGRPEFKTASRAESAAE